MPERRPAPSMRVRWLVFGVDALAAVGTWLLIPHQAPGYLLGLSVLATLAVVGGGGPIRIPSLKSSISTSDAFVLTAIGAFGPVAAVTVAATGVVGSLFGPQPPRPIQFAFNIGNMSLSAVLASAAYLATGGVPGGSVGEQVLPLFAATIAYFMANTGLVATVICVDTRKDFFGTWKVSARWAGLSAWLGLTIATGGLWAIQRLGVTALALGLPPVWMLAAFLRAHKERQERQQQRIHQVEDINQQLEDKVAERTRELSETLSDLEKTNTQLSTTNEQLIAANRAKNEFLANVSHELRTPLNAIIGFSDLLRDEPTSRLDATQEEYVRDIHDSGEHLLNLINNILDVSKIEAGKLLARCRAVDIPEAVQEATSMVVPQAQAKQLDIVVEVPEGLVAQLDPGMTRQILINLLSNAVKFTPPGGRIEIVAAASGDDLSLHVNDTGIGISEADMPNIFDEFYQVDGSYSRNYEGTGLGLALVRRLVQLHGGEITIESRLNEGSSFRCMFPGRVVGVVEPAKVERRKQADAPKPSTESTAECPISASPEPAGQGPAILVVEDNVLNRKLVRNALGCRGYRVIEAENGAMALEQALSHRLDLVLMDLQLPGMDGLEVIRRLKGDPRTASFPIVALTAHVREVDEQRARQAGCIGYITKPIRLADFPGQVKGYLDSGEILAEEDHGEDDHRHGGGGDEADRGSPDVVVEPARSVVVD